MGNKKVTTAHGKPTTRQTVNGEAMPVTFEAQSILRSTRLTVAIFPT
jgi:hypothetical protein